MKRLISFTIAWLICTITCPSLMGQETNPITSDLANQLSEDVVAIADIDLTQWESTSPSDFLAQVTAQLSVIDRDWILAQAAPVESYLQMFSDLHVERLVALIRLSDEALGGMAIGLQVDSSKVSDAIAAQAGRLLGRTDDPQVDGETGWIVFPAVNPQRKTPHRWREFDELLNEDADAAFRLVFVPSSDQRRVLREMVPSLPAPFEAIDGPLLADGLTKGSLRVVSSNELAVSVTIHSEDLDAGRQLHERLQATLLRLKQGGWIRLDGDDRSLGLDEFLPEPQSRVWRLTFDQQDQRLNRLVHTFDTAIARGRHIATVDKTIANMRQIGLAMHNYHDVYKKMPDRYSVNDAGAPLLSWRVAILPFIDVELYMEFRVDEPWDSPHNRTLISRMPDVFRSPFLVAAESGRTTYQGVVGPGFVFDEQESPAFRDFKDGLSNTILIAETTSDHAVPWTKPDDLQVPMVEIPAAVFADPDGVRRVLFADGAIRTVDLTGDSTDWLKWFTYDGED